MEGCRCSGVEDPLELALCLAPPPGDHEVVVETRLLSRIVLNEEGVFLRSVARDEFLPFLGSVERPASRAAVEAGLSSVGLSLDDLPRLAAEKLVEAAEAGSRRARSKLEKCRGLVERLLRGS